MKRVILALLSLVGVGMLFVAGLTLSTAAGVVGRGGSYDMPPEQTRAFIAAAAIKRGWTFEPGIARSAVPKPGEVQTDYAAPLLPWSSARVTVISWPERAGTAVMVTGHAAKVKELSDALSAQLPTLLKP